jgi:hypothetical protein
VTTPGLNWTFVKGNGSSNPSTAHTGAYNACLKDNSSADNKTRLVSPKLNLSGLPQPQLKFWHTQEFWSPDQDQLTVFYKTSANGTWTQLANYSNNLSAWTLETIPLPNPSSTYYISFEGNAKYGHGICVDDVQVSSSCVSILPVGIFITASANPANVGSVVNFTASPSNGGISPAYQWKVNGVNIGVNSPLFSYIPANNDVVICVLTSSETCAGGNPATSNEIVMSIVGVATNTSLQSILLGTGQTACYDATETIVVAGGEGLFTVQNGGLATMIAGHAIFYEPGTKVNPGGYMHGYITTTGDFCNPNDKSVVAASMADPLRKSEQDPGRYKIYPNPTTGLFSLEVKGYVADEMIQVDIFNMQGDKVICRNLPGVQKIEFSLSGKPSGIYLIRVTTLRTSESFRLIKL